MPLVTIKDLPPRMRAIYDRAAEAARQRNFDYAVQLFSDVIKECPEFIDGRRELHQTLTMRCGGKVNPLMQSKVAMKFGIALSMKIPALVKKGQLWEAIAACEEVLVEDPSNLQAIKIIAESAMSAGNDALAIEILEHSLIFHPKDLDFHTALIKLYVTNLMASRAIELCKKLEKLYPERGEILTLRKNAEAKSAMENSSWGREEQTAQAESQAASQAAAQATSQPNMESTAFFERAEMSPAELQQELDKLLALMNAGNDNNGVRKRIARVLMRLNRYDEAKEILSAAVEACGDNVDIALQRLIYQCVEEQLQHAITAWEQWKVGAAETEHAGADEEIAKLRAQLNEFLFQKAKEMATIYAKDPNFGMEYGLKLIERELYKEAYDEFRKAASSPRHRRKAIFYKALCCVKTNRLDEAITDLEAQLEATDLSPVERHDTLRLCARAYVKADKKDKASTLETKLTSEFAEAPAGSIFH